MNADQKKRIAHEISNWKNAATESDASACFLTGDRMADLLQELADAPEPKSCSWIRAIDEAMVTHHLGVADIADDYEAAKKKLNTLLSLNQDIGEYFSAKAPAPSVPDGWRLVPYTPTVLMLERAEYAVNNRPQPSKYEPSATPAIIFWTAMLNYAPQAPAVQTDQSEQHLEMVKQELFQAQQALLNEGQQRDKLLAALVDLANQPQDITTPAYQNALAALAATE